jgi:hypothetical protein
MAIDWRRIEVLDEATLDIFRRKTPAERLAIANDANQAARRMIAVHLRSLHADWTDEEVAREVARRMNGGSN